MTSRERFQRMFEHADADRIPIIDSPWGDTLARWREEGLPDNVGWDDYFDIDHVAGIGADFSPRWPSRRLEETDDYVIDLTSWGVTLKNLKTTSVPQYLDFRIKDPDSWREARERMAPSDDRIDWNYLKANYKGWREKGFWIQGNLWFGFDATHACVDMELLLEAMIQQPEWCKEMFDYHVDLSLKLMDRVWEEGYEFDSIFWCDDMGYKHHPFFSLKTYRELLKPAQKRAIDWAHAKGIKAHLHSCGCVNAFVPEWIELGLDALNPLEVKAGMDPIHLKETYGDKLVLHGGVNAVLWDDLEAIEEEMRKVIPVAKRHGGYIFSSDHSIPKSVSFEGMRRIISLAKELGSYE